jgi:hypothetical protein
MIRLLSKRLRLAGFVFCVMSALTTSSTLAHQFHTSVAELDWNADSGRWEVSVRIHASDLELALDRQFGRKLNIESSGATEWIQKYVQSRFQIVSQDAVEKLALPVDRTSKSANETANTSQIDWVGQEVEGGWMWLYFELAQPDSKQPLALVSQLLTEINEDQNNIVSIRNATRKRSTQQTSRKQVWIAL